MVIVYTVSSVSGFFLSSFLAYYGQIPFFFGAGYTIGASAPVFGLLGALVYYGRRGGSSMVRSQAMSYAVILFVFGIVSPGGGIDHYAHLGGFGGGFLTARVFNPHEPERFNHMLGALGCLLMTALAIVVSILGGTVQFR